MLAAKMATVVDQPRTFIARPLTRGPMILRLFVMSMMNSIRGGVEKPYTMPAHTRALMGLMPAKFTPAAMRLNATMAPQNFLACPGF
jgi:hypothetical protein